MSALTLLLTDGPPAAGERPGAAGSVPLPNNQASQTPTSNSTSRRPPSLGAGAVDRDPPSLGAGAVERCQVALRGLGGEATLGEVVQLGASLDSIACLSVAVCLPYYSSMVAEARGPSRQSGSAIAMQGMRQHGELQQEAERGSAA